MVLSKFSCILFLSVSCMRKFACIILVLHVLSAAANMRCGATQNVVPALQAVARQYSAVECSTAPH